MKKKKDLENDLPAQAGEITIEKDEELTENSILGGDPVKKLREKLKKCVEEKQEYLDGWQRAKADLINTKKEFESSRGDLVSFANEKIILDLIPVLESFDMAFSDKEVWEKMDETWRKGVENIHSKLVSILTENGVEILDPVDEEFDPKFHASVGVIKVDDKKKEGIIIDVIQKGYNLNQKNIRPANVRIGEYQEGSPPMET